MKYQLDARTLGVTIEGLGVSSGGREGPRFQKFIEGIAEAAKDLNPDIHVGLYLHGIYIRLSFAFYDSLYLAYRGAEPRYLQATPMSEGMQTVVLEPIENLIRVVH
jgi:hypothetical protein